MYFMELTIKLKSSLKIYQHIHRTWKAITEKQKEIILFILINYVKNQAGFKNKQIKRIYKTVFDLYKDLLKDIKKFLKELL